MKELSDLRPHAKRYPHDFYHHVWCYHHHNLEQLGALVTLAEGRS